MLEDRLNPFFSELLDFFTSKETDPFASGVLKEGLSPSACDQLLPLSEIIDHYQHLFGAKGPIHIEKLLMESFPIKDFIELKLTRYYPKMMRGLPRLYCRSLPSQSHIKRTFVHLPTLRKQAVAKAVYSLYKKWVPQGKVALVTSLPIEGSVASAVLGLLKSRFPQLTVQLICLKGDGSAVSPEVLTRLKKSDFCLQVLKLHPQSSEWKVPKMALLGDYGFGESSWFHPQSGGYSMGLHFLEKGVLLTKLAEANWETIKNREVQFWKKGENLVFWASLSSFVGGAIYLHALLKSLENNPTDIDLYVPSIQWFIEYTEKQNQAKRPLLEWEMGVARIEVHTDGRIASLPLAQTGKLVRILAPQSINSSDRQALMQLSDGLIAVGDNESLSEALSLGIPFFFDPHESARYFMKDLVALAENRIGSHRSTLACFQAMNQNFLLHLSGQEGEWVDETFFQEREEWTSIALSMGVALQNPEYRQGFEKLAQIIASEFSCNAFICHMVQRAFCHIQYPDIERIEVELMARFSTGSCTFSDLIRTLTPIIQEE